MTSRILFFDNPELAHAFLAVPFETSNRQSTICESPCDPTRVRVTIAHIVSSVLTGFPMLAGNCVCVCTNGAPVKVSKPSRTSKSRLCDRARAHAQCNRPNSMHRDATPPCGLNVECIRLANGVCVCVCVFFKFVYVCVSVLFALLRSSASSA